jgi:hypothetical protein
MTIYEFIGKTDLRMIRFSISLLNEIETKIIKKQFISQNQALNYAKNRIHGFLKQTHLKRAVIAVYKYELYLYIKRKLLPIFQKYNVLTCA